MTKKESLHPIQQREITELAHRELLMQELLLTRIGNREAETLNPLGRAIQNLNLINKISRNPHIKHYFDSTGDTVEITSRSRVSDDKKQSYTVFTDQFGLQIELNNYRGWSGANLLSEQDLIRIWEIGKDQNIINKLSELTELQVIEKFKRVIK